MAGMSMNDIKVRIRSVESTMQITKAMELVSTSKLRKAKERAENSRHYFDLMFKAVSDIRRGLDGCSSPYVTEREIKKTCYIAIAGDRGLSGGYNGNVFKLTANLSDGIDFCVVPIGKKACEHFSRCGAEVVTDRYSVAAAVGVKECKEIADSVCEMYLDGKIDRIVLVYTNFVSMLSQTEASLDILPLEKTEEKGRFKSNVLSETHEEDLLDTIIPNYVAGMLYCAVCESSASEFGARRNAMSSANKNAQELIENLSLTYNRARQAAITSEITEIVSGAETM